MYIGTLYMENPVRLPSLMSAVSNQLIARWVNCGKPLRDYATKVTMKIVTGQEKNLGSVERHHVMSIGELCEVKMYNIGQSAAKHLNLYGMVKVHRLNTRR